MTLLVEILLYPVGRKAIRSDLINEQLYTLLSGKVCAVQLKFISLLCYILAEMICW
jgi:hypothetical protein